ncbi:MAG: dienelactone hydrolase family protein [Myxococcaceae bacterium]|jgi:predicted alpha/beta-hydrolase family hydrolase|nr:dienelactone hydrolase family protein [Myxococcaceae bacterium]
MNLVWLPGFNGAARQPLLTRLASALGPAHRSLFPGLPRGRPSEGLVRERTFLAEAIGAATFAEPPVLVGRSFGGRVALRHAVTAPVQAVVLLGFPVRPPGRPRPDDEAALRAVPVPTLIVQGDADEKGPLDVLAPLVESNPHLSLVVLPNTGHGFGRRQEREAAGALARFLEALGRPVSRSRRRV